MNGIRTKKVVSVDSREEKSYLMKLNSNSGLDWRNVYESALVEYEYVTNTQARTTNTYSSTP